MWIAIAGAWIIGSVVFYNCLVRSAKPMEDDICTKCENKECSGCESCAIIEDELRKAA